MNEKAGKTNIGKRLSTLDPLIKIVCFAKKEIIFSLQRGADLNLSVQGGHCTEPFPFSKTSLEKD
jgi:hypothetical protein